MIEYSLIDGHVIKNNEATVVKIISREEFAELQNIPEVISEWIRHEETHAPYCKSEIEGEYLLKSYFHPYCNLVFIIIHYINRKCVLYCERRN